MQRPTWDQYFMRIAREVSGRSTCMRRKVGAVLVREKRLLTTGYNGAPRGISHCTDRGCMREQLNVPSGERHELCRGLHAEMNALLQAADHGVQVRGSVLYCTNTPCSLCTKMLINAGIERVVAHEGYPDDLAAEMLREAGIPIDQITPSDPDKTELS